METIPDGCSDDLTVFTVQDKNYLPSTKYGFRKMVEYYNGTEQCELPDGNIVKCDGHWQINAFFKATLQYRGKYYSGFILLPIDVKIVDPEPSKASP